MAETGSEKASQAGPGAPKPKSTAGLVFGILGVVAGAISIPVFSAVFVPLSFIFNLLALFMRQYALGIVGMILAAIGFATSPTLMIGLGLTTAAVSKISTASKAPVVTKATPQPSRTTTPSASMQGQQQKPQATPQKEPLRFVEPEYGVWIPPSANQEMPLSVEGQQDTINATKDQSCKFIYKGNSSAPYEDRYIVNNGIDCSTGLLHGNGRASVFRIDGKMLGEVSGAFSRGYFTYDKVWDQPFVGRYRMRSSYSKDYLISLIGTDKTLGINVIAYLLHNNTKWRWEWCNHSAPTIGIITNNPEVFKRQDTILPLIQTAANLASFECSEAKKFTVIASPYPTAPMEDSDDKAYFSAIAFTDGKTWGYDPNDRKTVNHYLDRVARYRQLNAQP